MEEFNELDSTCGISDDELTERFKEAIRIENEIKKSKESQLRDMMWKRKLLISNIRMEGENM